jgi:putative sterol carrier protein
MNRGIDSLMRLARLGARFGSEADRAELRGIQGTLNLDFTGDDGCAWHLGFSEAGIAVAPGLAPEPRATVRVRAQDFLALVAGDQTISIARLTGRIRVAGDGNLGMAFSGFVGSLQNAQRAPGLRGWIARAVVQRALRRGGYRAGPARAAPSAS